MIEYKPNPGTEPPAAAANFIVCAKLRNGSFRGGYRVCDLRWTLEDKPDDIAFYATITRGTHSAKAPARSSG